MNYYLRSTCYITRCAPLNIWKKRTNETVRPICLNESSVLCFSLYFATVPTMFCFPPGTQPLKSSQKPSQNQTEMNLLSVFPAEGSSTKGFTVGTTVGARHPDSLCLLFQATALPDGLPAPTSSLPQNASL